MPRNKIPTLDKFLIPKQRPVQRDDPDKDGQTEKNETAIPEESKLEDKSEVLSKLEGIKVNKSIPPYHDIACLANTHQPIDSEVKKDILEKTWDDVHSFSFPYREMSGRKRRLSPNWLVENKWMRYSVEEDALYCAPCFLFGRKDAKDKLFISPVSDWSNLSCFVKRHMKSDSPHFTYQAMADDFLRVKNSIDDPISYKISESRKSDVVRNRHALRKIIEVLLLCGKQNIPIRGHIPERSNFMQILNFKATDDALLAEHLRSSVREKYTSPDIQNEIINIIGNQIRQKIVTQCNSSKFFALIADETTDSLTKEQVSVCLRYVTQEIKENGLNVIVTREDFIEFVEAESTTGEHLSQLLLGTLTRAGVDIMKMRAQGYDGASNMSGKNKGVQARIRELVPGAVYVHCKSHCLNLAIVHSCKDTNVRNVMSTVQEVAFAFDYSAKRLLAFYNELKADVPTKQEMDRRTKLRTLCETRWTSRADSLYTFKTAFPVVIHALEQLEDDGDDKAKQHLSSIMRFDFVIALVIAEHILQSTVYLSTFLQGKQCDLVEATKECKVVIETLRHERADDSVWDELYQVAVDMGQPFDITPSMPRRVPRQRNRENHPADTAKQYWRVSTYLPFLDHMIQELESRLLAHEDRFLAQHLLPRVVDSITRQQIRIIYEAYTDDLNTSYDIFEAEVFKWKRRWAMTNQDLKPCALCDTLDATNENFYPCIHTILCIILTMPVASASAERSFSTLRCVKTYVRSTMRNERLSALALMHIHRDIQVDEERVAFEFATKKPRRADFGY